MKTVEQQSTFALFFLTDVESVDETLILFKRPNSDLSQTSHCNIKGLSVREVMRIETMIAQVQFY